MESSHSEGKMVQRMVFLGLFAGLFILVALLFRPFFSVFLWASLLYGLLQPLYRRATLRKDGGERPRRLRSLHAALFSLGSLLLVTLPLAFLGVAFAGQLSELLGVFTGIVDKAATLLHGEGFARFGSELARLSGGAIDLGSMDVPGELAALAATYGERLVSLTATLLGNLAGFGVTMAFFLFVMFFLFLDGNELLGVFIDAMPLRNEYTALFVAKFRDTSRELFLGYVLVALFQGFMAFLVFSVMKVPAPIPLALLCAMASFIPVVGAALVWLPVSLMRLATGTVLDAALLSVLSALLISSLDNFIRPFLLHARIKLHPLLIFVSIIGGIRLFGFDGLLLGPVILVLFFTVVDVFGKLYGRTRSGAGPEKAALPGAGVEGGN